jgi:hypothetical protein
MLRKEDAHMSEPAAFQVISAVTRDLIKEGHECTESLVRQLIKRGVCTPLRDDTGRKLLTTRDKALLREALVKRAAA